jgi:5-bromo-4-chloroindolyl phosphate hydrolysis protein
MCFLSKKDKKIEGLEQHKRILHEKELKRKERKHLRCPLNTAKNNKRGWARTVEEQELPDVPEVEFILCSL